MDRAQRQLHAQTEVIARTQTQLVQAATSTLPHEAQLAALDRQSQQLADAERTQSGYRRLRARFDPDEFDRNLQAISAIADPVQQRESLTQLQASYAGFAFNPEIARRRDAQFAGFEPVVQRREAGEPPRCHRGRPLCPHARRRAPALPRPQDQHLRRSRLPRHRLTLAEYADATGHKESGEEAFSGMLGLLKGTPDSLRQTFFRYSGLGLPEPRNAECCAGAQLATLKGCVLPSRP